MIEIENECVDCGLPCLGNSCKYRNVKHYYCDDCGCDEKLYEYEDKQLCKDCLLNYFDEVE